MMHLSQTKNPKMLALALVMLWSSSGQAAADPKTDPKPLTCHWKVSSPSLLQAIKADLTLPPIESDPEPEKKVRKQEATYKTVRKQTITKATGKKDDVTHTSEITNSFTETASEFPPDKSDPCDLPKEGEKATPAKPDDPNAELRNEVIKLREEVPKLELAEACTNKLSDEKDELEKRKAAYDKRKLIEKEQPQQVKLEIDDLNCLLIKGPADRVLTTLFYLATRLDAPRPQVRLTTWTIQVNSDESNFDGTLDKVRTIETGVVLCRGFARVFLRRLGSVARQCIKNGNISECDKEILKKVGFEVTERDLSLFDILTIFCLSDRKFLNEEFARLEDNWSQILDQQIELYQKYENQALSCKEREEYEKLGKLLKKLKTRADVLVVGRKNGPRCRLSTIFAPAAAVPNHPLDSTSTNSERNSLLNFAKSYCDANPGIGMKAQTCSLDIKKPLDGIMKLRRQMQGADRLVTASCDAVSDDLNFALYDPLIEWVREIASETNELNIVGKQELVASSGLQITSKTEAINFHPFLKFNQTEQDLAKGVVRSLVTAPELDINLIPQLLLNEKLFNLKDSFTYASVTPGTDLSVTPRMLPGGRETHLKIDLQHHVDSKIDKDAQSDFLKPVSFVNSSKLTTDVTVESYDIFELATQTLQSTRQGGPTWSIPILSDIPLIGKFLFTGPDRPRTKYNGVIILSSSMVVPRSMDLVRN